jgi:hypothetical protein
MRRNHKWINWSIVGLCTVGLLGLLLRSKIVFALPLVNYNHVLEGHSHFTFTGWVTLALLTLMTEEFLPAGLSNKKSYQLMFGGIVISAWGMLIAFVSKGYNISSTAFSLLFIILTYLFGYFFIRDVRKAKISSSVRLLAISSIACLIISSFGSIIIFYIYFTNSFQAFLYRDSLFTYLHFQYNGFFSLAIFALLFHQVEQNISTSQKKIMRRFANVLTISIMPSLFLSYLWQDPDKILRIIAIAGSISVLLSFILFMRVAWTLRNIFHQEKPVLRFLIIISMSSFTLKLFLQCFTIFPVIGNSIFGDRPIIMGFLHLVFLGFVSLFLLAHFAHEKLLNGNNNFTKIALLVFAIGILMNEVLLITQGLTTLFMPGSVFFLWLLWLVAIWLFIGTILIAIARLRTRSFM